MRRITSFECHFSSCRKACVALFAMLLTIGAVNQRADGMQLASGSYTGNGAPSRAVVGAGFRPDAVIIKGNTNQYAVIRTETMPDGMAKAIAAKEEMYPRRIQS